MIIYPNPLIEGNNTLTIEAKDSEIERWELFDMGGNKLLEGKMVIIEERSQVFLEGIYKGNYLLWITGKNNTYIEKIIID